MDENSFVTKVGARFLARVGSIFGWAEEPVKKLIDGKVEAYNLIHRAISENEAVLLDSMYDIPKKLIESPNPIENLAGIRIYHEVFREQQNIGDVLLEALPNLSESARPEDIDEDWLVNSMGHTRKVSDPDMRTLWARLLAGEADNPGSYSKKTVNILADMDKSTAISFTMHCKFACKVDGLRKLFIVPNYLEPIFNSGRIDYYSLAALQALGLIEVSAVGGFSHLSDSRYTTIRYFDSAMILESNREISVGQVSFTPFGSQLAALVQPICVPGFFDHLTNFYKQQKNISSVIPIHSEDALLCSKSDSLDSREGGNDDTQLVTGVHGADRMN